MEEGQLRRCSSGENVGVGEGIGFMLKGSFAVFDRRNLACVNLVGPGGTFGWEASLAPGRKTHRLLALLESEWIELPAPVPLQTMGAVWLERVFARHALDRIDALEGASACHAVHPVHQRVANLIRRLSLSGEGDVRTTQAALAQAAGVQRTSVNASVKVLERAGAIAIRRGRLRILDTGLMDRLSCGC